MVNIRATSPRPARRIVTETCRSAVRIAKALFYKSAVTSSTAIRRRCRITSDITTLSREWLQHGRVDRKRLDAEAMFNAICAHIARHGSMKVAYDLADPWRGDRAAARAGLVRIGRLIK